MAKGPRHLTIRHRQRLRGAAKNWRVRTVDTVDLQRSMGLKDKEVAEKLADALAHLEDEGNMLGDSSHLHEHSNARQPWVLVLVMNLLMALSLMMFSALFVIDTSDLEASEAYWRALILGSRPTEGMLNSWGPGAIVAVTGMIGLVIFSVNAGSSPTKQPRVSKTGEETIRFGSKVAASFGFPLLAFCSAASIAMLIATLRSGHNAPFILIFCTFNIFACVDMQSNPALRGHIKKEHQKSRLVLLSREIASWSVSSIDSRAETKLRLHWLGRGFWWVNIGLALVVIVCFTSNSLASVRASLGLTCVLLLLVNVIQQLLAIVEKYDPLEKFTMRRFYLIILGLLHVSILLSTLEQYSMNDTEVAITLGLTSMVSAFVWSVWLGLLSSKEYRSWNMVKKCKAWVELTSVKEKPKKTKRFGKTKPPLSAEEVKDGTRTVWDLFSEMPARVRGDSKVEAEISESREDGWVPVDEADS